MAREKDETLAAGTGFFLAAPPAEVLDFEAVLGEDEAEAEAAFGEG